MTNKVVEKYLNNFSLINTQGLEAFARSCRYDHRLSGHAHETWYRRILPRSGRVVEAFSIESSIAQRIPRRHSCACFSSRVEPAWACHTGQWQDCERGERT